MIISGVTEILLLVRTDYAAQIVTIQKYLALLRQWRIRTKRWFGLAQWILWFPGTLVMLEYLIGFDLWAHSPATVGWFLAVSIAGLRSEEHTSELPSLMRISYDVFCMKKKSIKPTE